jgi:hypothetical protein
MGSFLMEQRQANARKFMLERGDVPLARARSGFAPYYTETSYPQRASSAVAVAFAATLTYKLVNFLIIDFCIYSLTIHRFTVRELRNKCIR